MVGVTDEATLPQCMTSPSPRRPGLPSLVPAAVTWAWSAGVRRVAGLELPTST